LGDEFVCRLLRLARGGLVQGLPCAATEGGRLACRAA